MPEFEPRWIRRKTQQTTFGGSAKRAKSPLKPPFGTFGTLAGRYSETKKDQREEWEYMPIELPSLKPGFVDVWMSGTRLDRPGEYCAWFVETRKREGKEA